MSDNSSSGTVIAEITALNLFFRWSHASLGPNAVKCVLCQQRLAHGSGDTIMRAVGNSTVVPQPDPVTIAQHAPCGATYHATCFTKFRDHCGGFNSTECVGCRQPTTEESILMIDALSLPTLP